MYDTQVLIDLIDNFISVYDDTSADPVVAYRALKPIIDQINHEIPKLKWDPDYINRIITVNNVWYAISKAGGERL